MGGKEHTGFIEHLHLGIRAGLLGGIAAGLLEVLYITHFGFAPAHFSALLFAVILYSSLGIPTGLGYSLLFLVTKPPRDFGITLFNLTLLSVAYFIVQFYIFKNYHREIIRHTEPVGLVTMLILLLVTIPIYFLIRWILTRFGLKFFNSILRPARTYTLVAALLFIGLILHFSLSRSAEVVSTAYNAANQARLKDKPYVIFIIIDTLRPDRLGCYGGPEAAKTPNIDAVARDGILFKQHYAQASHTKPSTASLITSRYPTEHQAIFKTNSLPLKVVTLAEVLSGAGYYCGGVIVNVNLAPIYNFNQGYNEYTYLAPQFFLNANHAASRLALYILLNKYHWYFLKNLNVDEFYSNAERVVKTGQDIIQRNEDKKFLLFMHFMDPHDPYFEHPYNGKAYASTLMPDPDPSFVKPFKYNYQQEIEYLDDWFGRLITDLKDRGIYDNSLIIVTSDHGEEFYEHGGWWHGMTLHAEQVHVPLIIKKPHNVNAGTVVTHPTKHLDVVPTILAQLNLDQPAMMHGFDLFDSLAQSQDSLIFSEADFIGNQVHMLRIGDWKYIETNVNNPRHRPPKQLFNLADDPNELNNLVDRLPDKAAEMESLMHQKYSVIQSTKEAAVEGEIDQTTKDRLRALGYTQ
jgi:arylsulfatase A-like enzyme